MNKKLLSVAVGIALLASPLIASAQTTSTDNPSVIAALEQLIATLTQELEQLLAAHSGQTSSSVATSPVMVQNQNGQMTATLTGPNTWQFSISGRFNQVQQHQAIDFGDGTTENVSCTQDYSSGGPSLCQVIPISHTYAGPGNFPVKFDEVMYGDGGPYYSTTTIFSLQLNNQATNNTAAGQTCSTYANLQKGNTDATTGGQVSQLQSFVGIYPTTGYYGAQTSIAYQNKCGNLGNAQPVSVAGMSEYTDAAFGFSFWYPTGWNVVQVPGMGSDLFQGGTITKQIAISSGTAMDDGVTIQEFYSPNASITELGQSETASPVGVDQKYFFGSGEWMYENLTAEPNGNVPAGTITPADISRNTMGGLHMLSGAARFGGDTIVPLSANNFLIISSNDGGTAFQQNPLVQTIVATNPAVAIPVSTAQQIATIQAEESAYAGQ